MEHKLLLVDDEQNVLKALERVLRPYGFHLLTANSGSQALELLEEHSVAVIVTDQCMPAMTGVELLGKVREKFPDTVRIVLTGHSDVDIVTGAINHGEAYKFLLKPWDPEVLYQTIEQAFLNFKLREQNKQIVGDLQKANTALDDYNRNLSRKIQQKSDQLQYLTRYDPLTGLPNRVGLVDKLHAAIRKAKIDADKFAVVLLDLDCFKRINECLGHFGGDQILREVARRIERRIGNNDALARCEGDQFVVIRSGLTDDATIAGAVQELISVFKDPFNMPGGDLFLTVSVGVSVYPGDGDTEEILLRSAEAAVYQAKELGRGYSEFFDATLNCRAQQRLKLESELRYALTRNEFELYYQPQVDILNGDIVGIEALLRWNHPVHGVLEPNEFLKSLEDTGLIVPVGEWILRTACQQNRAWSDAGFPSMRIAVNLSARQFQHPNLVDRVRAIIEEAGLDYTAQCLELELTESLIMDPHGGADATLAQLDQMGIQLAIDDFGTGYSCLSYLKRFPIRTLKVDRSFVAGVPGNADDVAIVTAICALAQSMNIRCIAEGIENQAQLDFMRRLGCDEYQGFVFTEPLRAVEMTEILKHVPPAATPRATGSGG